MPELFSRMDLVNWLTPSIADILDQGPAPPGGDGSIRERMLTLQRELAELDTPARIVNVRSTPSYTLYIARPETVGRLGNRRTITPNELKRSIGRIAESHKDWTLGFMPQMRDDESTVGILLRTAEHRPLSLRRLLVRSTFRNYKSTFAFVCGITLEQQIVVRDVLSLGHLHIIGEDGARQHFIRGMILTLMLLNTPSELRLAMVGQGSEAYKPFVGTPHTLGRILVLPSDGRRLLDGLVKEIQRRQKAFNDANVDNITEYNAALQDTGKTGIPRILLVMDSASEPAWQQNYQQWAPAVSELLQKGVTVGIHIVITSNQEEIQGVAPEILKSLPVRVVMRSAGKTIAEELPQFHASLMRFVDAFVLQDDDESSPTPIELCAISNLEINKAVEYWRANAKQRYEEAQMQSISGKTGVTDILTPNEEAEPRLKTPPVPQKPSSSALAKATQVLERIAVKPEETTIVEENNNHLAVEPASAAKVQILKQAQALAAYLGWLGVGPLQDIFGYTLEEAEVIVAELQRQGVLEYTDCAIARFMPLSQEQMPE